MQHDNEDLDPQGTHEGSIEVIKGIRSRVKKLEAFIEQTGTPSSDTEALQKSNESCLTMQTNWCSLCEMSWRMCTMSAISWWPKVGMLEAQVKSTRGGGPGQNVHGRSKSDQQTLQNTILDLKDDLQFEANQRAMLSAEAKQSAEEIGRLNAVIKKSEAERKELATTIRNLKEEGSVWTIIDYLASYNRLPRYGGRRPDEGSLLPVSNATQSYSELRKYLGKVCVDCPQMNSNIICLQTPECFTWASTACQVGFAFGPQHQYIGGLTGWVKHSEFTDVYGTEVQLFLRKGDCIYYAGAYLVRDIRKENPQGSVLAHAQSAKVLTQLTVVNPRSPPSDEATDAHRRALNSMTERLYTEGLLKVECAVLQCVGFNHKIHDTVVQKYNSASYRRLFDRMGNPGSRSPPPKMRRLY
ncbi:hypothetical protein DFP72DRAFT_909055 [Ephemerocybe angulata]|uniref:Uncharacterized protein n=1 Tax=Ephemerocybe angulata TaxID=980116 RepID=A0A8H6HPZ1_9AGAR|nr:hypothetical protein DFP72DRAFT_909055 [Tulosesus angulatus]